MKKSSRRALMSMLFLTSIGYQNLSAQEAATTEDLPVLEAFIAEQTALEDLNSLLQTERSISSLGFGNQQIIDIPRSVTPLSPETLEQYQIDDVYDLARVVPGASVTNFYGVPGIPTTRGLFTSLYFNGMQRVWNRNGYPTSFGSLEAMEYVKGPPPPSYSAASPGGFVNFVPKSPYFDKFRGSVSLEAGRWDHLKMQVDVGGPVLLGEKPAAFRISAARQEADSYYDEIFNDYTSVYGAIKVKLSDRLSLFGGGEFYQHRSKENPGWNRVTQDLIDNGNYIVGNPATDITTVQADGSVKVDRTLIDVATPFGGTFGGGDFGNTFAGQGLPYDGFNPNILTPAQQAFYSGLGGLNNPGAGVTTTKIKGSTVLTDEADFADADTYLAFLDFIFNSNPDTTITFKSFFDGYKREKYSTYGYAEYGENYTFEQKAVIDQYVDFLGLFPSQLSYGGSIRHEDSLALTDFTVEPFSRRDITQPVGPNTRLPTGFDIVNGVTSWDPYGSVESRLTTMGAFFNIAAEITEDLTIIAGVRGDKAEWYSKIPDDQNLQTGLFNAEPGRTLSDDKKTYTSFSISPSYKITDKLTAYYTYQKGTAFQGFYVSGSVDRGDTNFQESELQEFGLRASLLDDKLFLGATYFMQDLVNFDARGGAAVPQSGKGVEMEATWVVTDNFTVQANATWQSHEYETATIPGGFVPLTAEQYVDYAGIFYADFGGRPNPGGDRFGIPEWSGSILARYEFDNGFGISGGPSYTDSMYGNPDKTLKLPSYLTWNANIFYKSEKFDVFLSGSNLTSEDYFFPSDAFAANAIITKAPPISWNLKVVYKF